MTKGTFPLSLKPPLLSGNLKAEGEFSAADFLKAVPTVQRQWAHL